jgi:hypothetical protein
MLLLAYNHNIIGNQTQRHTQTMTSPSFPVFLFFAASPLESIAFVTTPSIAVTARRYQASANVSDLSF